MSPLQILEDEIQTLCAGVRYSHKRFQDALFRAEASATDFDRNFNISPETRILTAKQLARKYIEDIRLLRKLQHRIRFVAKVTRKRGKRV